LARPTHTPPHDVLDDINSFADHLRDWIAGNPVPVVTGAVLALALAAGVGGWRWWDTRREDRAAAALAKLEGEYRTAMGAGPGVAEVPEPANPETATATRREYATKLLALAQENDGTGAATLARLAAADRLSEVGEMPQAADELRAALPDLSASNPVRGLVLLRIAAAEESAGHWREAAEAYAEAGALPSFPLQAWAKADAARCYREAGDGARALALAQELGADPSATVNLPPNLSAALAEIRSGAPAATPAP